MIRMFKNNKGYSLIELIVVIAIMAVATGTAILSLSLLTDSESKKACTKIEAQLDEVKTGSMSRSDETLTVIYMNKGELNAQGNFTNSGENYSDGMYVVKRVWTLDAGTKKTESGVSGFIVTESSKKELNSESRLIAGKKVKVTLKYEGGECTVDNSNGNYFTIKYDRATGLLNDVDVYKDGGLTENAGKPLSITCTTNGNREYIINFNNQGKHTRSGI